MSRIRINLAVILAVSASSALGAESFARPASSELSPGPRVSLLVIEGGDADSRVRTAVNLAQKRAGQVLPSHVAIEISSRSCSDQACAIEQGRQQRTDHILFIHTQATPRGATVTLSVATTADGHTVSSAQVDIPVLQLVSPESPDGFFGERLCGKITAVGLEQANFGTAMGGLIEAAVLEDALRHGRQGIKAVPRAELRVGKKRLDELRACGRVDCAQDLGALLEMQTVLIRAAGEGRVRLTWIGDPCNAEQTTYSVRREESYALVASEKVVEIQTAISKLIVDLPAVCSGLRPCPPPKPPIPDPEPGQPRLESGTMVSEVVGPLLAGVGLVGVGISAVALESVDNQHGRTANTSRVMIPVSAAACALGVIVGILEPF